VRTLADGILSNLNTGRDESPSSERDGIARYTGRLLEIAPPSKKPMPPPGSLTAAKLPQDVPGGAEEPFRGDRALEGFGSRQIFVPSDASVGISESVTPRITGYSGFWTSRRIDRNRRVCARFAIAYGPRECLRRRESAESGKTYPGAILLGPRNIALDSPADGARKISDGTNTCYPFCIS